MSISMRNLGGLAFAVLLAAPGLAQELSPAEAAVLREDDGFCGEVEALAAPVDDK